MSRFSLHLRRSRKKKKETETLSGMELLTDACPPSYNISLFEKLPRKEKKQAVHISTAFALKFMLRVIFSRSPS